MKGRTPENVRRGGAARTTEGAHSIAGRWAPEAACGITRKRKKTHKPDDAKCRGKAPAAQRRQAPGAQRFGEHVRVEAGEVVRPVAWQSAVCAEGARPRAMDRQRCSTCRVAECRRSGASARQWQQSQRTSRSSWKKLHLLALFPPVLALLSLGQHRAALLLLCTCRWRRWSLVRSHRNRYRTSTRRMLLLYGR